MRTRLLFIAVSAVSTFAGSVAATTVGLADPPTKPAAPVARTDTDRRDQARVVAAEWLATQHQHAQSLQLAMGVAERTGTLFGERAWRVAGHARAKLGDHRGAADAFTRAGDPFAAGAAWFAAGDYAAADKAFVAASQLPDPYGQVNLIGHTPIATRAAIWRTWCRLRSGGATAAATLDAGYSLLGDRGNVQPRWAEEDRKRWARMTIEAAGADPAARRELIARGGPLLAEYCAAAAMVAAGDAAGVARYLGRHDSRFANTRNAWWAEIAAMAAANKPVADGIIAHAAAGIEQLRVGAWPDIQYFEWLVEAIPDGRWVAVVLEPEWIERITPNLSLARRLLHGYRAEGKASVLRLLASEKRRDREHGLKLLNAFEVYDRDTLDAGARVMAEEYHPVHMQGLLAFWRVSGETFGVAPVAGEKWQSIEDAPRRAAVAAAVAWWARRRETLKPDEPLPVAMDAARLRAALASPISTIKLDATERLAAAGDPVVLGPAGYPHYLIGVFPSHPREVIEFLLAREDYASLGRMVGVAFPELAGDALRKAWRGWWETHRDAYDFSIK